MPKLLDYLPSFQQGGPAEELQDIYQNWDGTPMVGVGEDIDGDSEFDRNMENALAIQSQMQSLTGSDLNSQGQNYLSKILQTSPMSDIGYYSSHVQHGSGKDARLSNVFSPMYYTGERDENDDRIFIPRLDPVEVLGVKPKQQGGPAERPPILGYMQPGFNPEGYGYDMNTAEEAGLERDEFGHMGSLDPRTGMVLKGRKHESWNPMVQEEMYRGNTVMYNPNEDRYFSIEGGMYEPAVQDETAHSQMDKLMFENELKQQPQYYMSEYEEGYDPVMDFAEGMMPVGLIGKTGKGGFNLLKKLLSSNKAGKAGKQILKEGSSKIKRATKLPEKFAKVGDHNIGVAEFTDDAGNIIKQPMYKSTGTSGYGGQRAGEWMPFLGKRGGEFHKGRYALGKGGKPVSHMIDFDKYGRVMEKSLSPRMKKILPSKSKFDWEARMTGPTGPDTGRMKQLSYDIKQLENKLDDLPLSKVEFKDLNKWLSKQGVKVPERTWIPETY